MKAARRKPRYVGDMRRVSVRPGDVFVLSVDEELTQETSHRMRNMLHEKLRGAEVIVLSKGMRLGVIGKADA